MKKLLTILTLIAIYLVAALMLLKMAPLLKLFAIVVVAGIGYLVGKNKSIGGVKGAIIGVLSALILAGAAELPLHIDYKMILTIFDKNPNCDEFNGQVFSSTDDIPDDFTGVAKICDDGKLKEQIDYNDGKKDGLLKGWHRDGGTKEANYRDGRLHGVSRVLYSNGQLRSEMIYKNGIVITDKSWYEDGQLKDEKIVKNGIVITDKSWYEDGQLKSETFKNGDGNRIDREWFSNGQLRAERIVKNKNCCLSQKYWDFNGNERNYDSDDNGGENNGEAGAAATGNNCYCD
jgi:antitoxin component YwqK of YwqJK toxin-antitoxin module